MLKTRNNFIKKAGFTIVELLIVIAIVGILATITIVGYGAWRHSTLSAAVKSDLNSLISALESKNTFDNAYPVLPTGALSSLDNFTPSDNVALSVFSSDATSYCIDATSTEDETITYYVASETKDQGPIEGDCNTRIDLPLPDVPGNPNIASAIGTTVNLEWDSSLNAADYTAQCASDNAFIFGLQSTTQASTTTIITGMTPSTTVYCRVKASNSSGSSDWSVTASHNTTNAYGSLAVATSIGGYWSSAPQGFLLEDGSAVSRTTYADLFAVIGTTYGVGDGSTTFNLPDSRGRTAVNRNTSDTEFDVIGEKPGSKTEQLTIAQMPSHTHQVPFLASGDPSDYLGGSAAAYGMVQTWAGRSGSYDLLEPVGGGGTHNNIQPSIVKISAIKYSPPEGLESTLPAATSIEGYWATAPSGYLLEDGSAVSRTTYADLFAVIGTTYGVGNGSTTFNLPDSRGRAAVNRNTSDTEFDVIGEKPGSKTEQLTIAQMPSHVHQVPWTSNGDPSDYLGGSGAGYGLTFWASRSGAYDMLEPVGGGGTHNNIQPSIVRVSAIKYTAAAGSIVASSTGTSIQGYWSSAPAGYLLEDGSAVSRTTYADLFAVIGTTHGSGNGSTTFNLPDSRGRIAVNRSTTDTEFDVIGEKYGAKTHTLTVAQIPSHTHQVPYLASGDVSDYLGGSGATYGITANWAGRQGFYDLLEPVGGGGSHNEIQPSIVKMFAIKY